MHDDDILLVLILDTKIMEKWECFFFFFACLLACLLTCFLAFFCPSSNFFFPPPFCRPAAVCRLLFRAGWLAGFSCSFQAEQTRPDQTRPDRDMLGIFPF